MGAFDRVLSGLPAMDRALDNIRMGDNVVWQVTDLDQFRLFAGAFASQAIRDGRNLIYIRFADHEPILPPMEGLRIIRVELSHRFETFTIHIHNIIEREGYDAFYVFDCLSELEEAWATDLMMGNFFHLTCPFLFQLDTVAYFPVLRGRHSFAAIDKIRDTTQLLLDVLPGDGDLYVRPLKVWRRSSDTMYQPHRFSPDTGEFRALSEGVEISRFYRRMNETAQAMQDQNMDSWERFFQLTELKHRSGLDVTAECARICDIMLTRDERLRELIKENFLPADYFAVHSRMVGTGMIGGKACGMLLARKLTENRRPDIFERIEPHDSFYIGSDVFYSYIVDNGFWDLKIRQKTEEGYFSLAEPFAEKIMEGRFSPDVEAEFRKLLDYYGSDPVIVRSSSILEDGFGNAFAGKYESVFCGSAGSPEERLQEFEQAIRTVYASTVGMSALDYRKRRGLEKLDEQMSLLVQRVSGSRYPDFYMPCAAGVGYSKSPYRRRSGRPDAGMLRLVMGLGTGAVDRNGGSYPKLVSLDEPTQCLTGTDAEKHRFSQRRIDVISPRDETLYGASLEEVEPMLPAYLKGMLLSHDRESESIYRERGESRSVWYVSCEGVVKNRRLMEDLRDILALLEEAYETPVDTEFTINLDRGGEYVVNLLQCRPLQVSRDGGAVRLPENVPAGDVLLETVGASMGFSRELRPDYIVHIDPEAYYGMEYRSKGEVARVLGRLNWALRDQGKTLVLLTPGRICTSSPELGVPTAFSDISEFRVICEVAESKVGYNPELSYGSHIFQDLVEAEILYGAVFQDQRTLTYAPERLNRLENVLTRLVPSADGRLEEVVRVYDMEGTDCTLYYDMPRDRLLCVLPGGKEK